MINGFNGENKFLSNFYPCVIEFEGIVYSTVEHAYQAAKTTDNELRGILAAQATPANVKRIGRNIKLREDWEEIKIPIMRTLLRKKFTYPRHTNLKDALLATKDHRLYETNYWHDNFWGSCNCDKCGNVGLNWLGKLLMELRDELQGNDSARPSETMAQNSQ